MARKLFDFGTFNVLKKKKKNHPPSDPTVPVPASSTEIERSRLLGTSVLGPG
ncbi:MAG: hypothetical protein ACRD1Z_12140 [Vicinamibacteria bacterium]